MHLDDARLSERPVCMDHDIYPSRKTFGIDALLGIVRGV